jgi:hypothetical protein
MLWLLSINLCLDYLLSRASIKSPVLVDISTPIQTKLLPLSLYFKKALPYLYGGISSDMMMLT